MKKPTISRDDAETIMIALDQVSQTIDVMNMIVGRLKNRMSNALEVRPHVEPRDTASNESAKKGQPGSMNSFKNGPLH